MSFVSKLFRLAFLLQFKIGIGEVERYGKGECLEPNLF